MDIRKETTIVTSGASDAEGQKLEPEQQVVQQVFDVGIPVSLGNEYIASMAGQVGMDTEAGVFASNLRKRCGYCKHFNRPKGQAYLRDLRKREMTDPEAAAELGQFRTAIDAGASDDYRDAFDQVNIEAVMADLGECDAITAIHSAFLRTEHHVIVAPEGGCPDMNGPSGEDLSNLFVARDRRARAEGASAYDTILKAADK